MRWEDERYVRVYTRDTPDWMALSWDARAVFLALLRKVDRAGLLVAEKSGFRGVAGCIGAPVEVVERAFPELLRDGCLRDMPGPPRGWIIQNFLAAQEATTSDAQRKRDQRERVRARAILGHASGQTVTVRDQMSRAVTSDHERSPLTVPSRAEPNQDLAAGAAVPVESPAAPPTPAQKPRQKPPAPARATNGAGELVLEAQTPHEPDRARQALIAALGECFLAIRGAAYTWGGRDFPALDRLRAKHPDDEILRRWERGLRAQYGARVSDISSLETRWNANATPEKGAEPPGPKSSWKPSGHCDLCNAPPGGKHDEWCTQGRTA